MNSFLRAIGGFGLALVMLVGCVTNRTPLTPEQKIDRLAATLRIAVSSAVTVATEDRKPETREKIALARSLVNGVLTSGDLSPEKIVESLTPLLRDAKPEVRLAATTALSLMEVYFMDYVVPLPEGEGAVNAKKFLSAVVAGIDEGLKLAPPVVQ